MFEGYTIKHLSTLFILPFHQVKRDQIYLFVEVFLSDKVVPDHTTAGVWEANPRLVVISFSLTHLPLDKMAAISQTTFSNSFRNWQVLYFDSNIAE